MRRRVLFLTYGYHPGIIGGAERQAQLQAEALTRRGWLVEVVCPRSPGTRTNRVSGVKIWRLPVFNRRPLIRLSYHILLFLFLLWRLRRFDLLHVHLGHVQTDVAALVTRLIRRPMAVKIACGGKRGEIQQLRSVAHFSRYYGLRQAAVVLAISEEIEREAVGAGVAKRRIRSMRNGVDLDLFTPSTPQEKQKLRERLSLPQAAVIALFVGRYDRQKGIDDLLSAWRRQNDASALVLVGSFQTAEPAWSLKDARAVILRPWTTSILEYYQVADVFVLPSHQEGMSNALLEAMACGLAVVATRVGAANSTIEDGKTGLLVNPGQPGELSVALARLLRDAGLRQCLGRNAARAARRRFSIEAVVDRIEATYAELLGT